MIKAFFKTPYFEWAGNQNQIWPGRNYEITRKKSTSYYYYDQLTVVDNIDINNEVSAPFVDSLNNAYSTPNHQYQLPIVENDGKITIYLPFLINGQNVTIHDVILDVNATVVYNQSTTTYEMTNVEPVVGDLVFEQYAPTTNQNNNPTTNVGDVNFDRGLVVVSQAPQYYTATITPDYYAQRTTGISGATACQSAFAPGFGGGWLAYANATSGGSLFKNIVSSAFYFSKYASNGISFESEE